MEKQSLGKNLLLTANVVTALNGLLADWNRTHLFNSKWPPHAKFHDGLTISVGMILGGLGIYALKRNGGDPAQNARLSALAPAIFFGAMVSAAAYPNSDSIDTEFPDFWPKIGRFSFNEVPFALSMLLLTAAGWKLVESRSPAARSRISQPDEESSERASVDLDTILAPTATG